MAKRISATSKGRFVRIQSTKTISVAPGLNLQDVTNPDAHVPDRLRVIPLWPQLVVQIRQGTGFYPSEIADWESVIELQKHNILTIGEFTDSADETAEETKSELIRKIEEVEAKETKIGKAKTLEEIVEE